MLLSELSALTMDIEQSDGAKLLSVDTAITDSPKTGEVGNHTERRASLPPKPKPALAANKKEQLKRRKTVLRFQLPRARFNSDESVNSTENDTPPATSSKNPFKEVRQFFNFLLFFFEKNQDFPPIVALLLIQQEVCVLRFSSSKKFNFKNQKHQYNIIFLLSGLS